MTNDLTRMQSAVQPAGTTSADPDEAHASPLLQQSSVLANAARNARERCAKGAEAVKEINARRNVSGQ